MTIIPETKCLRIFTERVNRGPLRSHMPFDLHPYEQAGGRNSWTQVSARSAALLPGSCPQNPHPGMSLLGLIPLDLQEEKASRHACPSGSHMRAGHGLFISEIVFTWHIIAPSSVFLWFLGFRGHSERAGHGPPRHESSSWVLKTALELGLRMLNLCPCVEESFQSRGQQGSGQSCIIASS